MELAQRQQPQPGELFLDHVAHFVPDLDAAAGVLEALGFHLTPAAQQTTRAPDGALAPAGTRFRSAMLAEGFLELIQPVADTERTRRMHARMNGRAGIYLVSFGTPSAQAEHARLAQHGFDPLMPARHERPGAGGTLARYRVAHVRHDTMPEGRVEYTEHETPAALWNAQSVTGLNAQCRLALLCAAAPDAEAAAARWAHFTGLLPEPAAGLVRMRLARGQLIIGTPEPNAIPAIAGYGLALDAPGTLVDKLRTLGWAPRELGPDLWSVMLPRTLGGGWLLGTRASLAAFPVPSERRSRARDFPH